MKIYYKVASIALAGVLATQVLIPMSALAEEDGIFVIGSQDDTEAVPAEDTAAVVTVAESEVPTEEQAVPATEITVSLPATSGEGKTEEEVNSEEPSNDGQESTPATDEATTDEATKTEETLSDVTSSEDTSNEETGDSTSEASTASSESVSEEKVPEVYENEVDEELTKEEIEKLENDEELELLEAKEDEDFNHDGINDLYTKMLCDGEILTESGKRVFEGYTYAQVQQNTDLDGDGIPNNEEVIIKTREDGTLYAVVTSDPCKVDTDGDGISDLDDTDKYHYGLYGGVVGNVRLVARHDDSQGFTHGHVYIVYTSYVDGNEISIDNLYSYYTTNPDKKEVLDAACEGENGSVVSWRSTVDEITDANAAERQEAAEEFYKQQNHTKGATGKVTLNRGDYVSIGNYGMATAEEVIFKDYIPFLTEGENALTEEEMAEVTSLVNQVLGQTLTVEYVKDHLGELIHILDMHGEAFTNHVLYDTTKGGVWINRELYNQKLEYDQGPNEVIEHDATQEQLNVMLDYFSSHSFFNTFTHNCTTVGAGAWNAVFGTKTDEAGNTVETEYHVNTGKEIHTQGYNPVTEKLEKTDTVISHPGAVKNSIKEKGDKKVDGYVGPVEYVTGTSLKHGIAKLIKKFDITKLFTKKTKSNTETGNDTPSSGNNESGNGSGSSNGSSNGSSDNNGGNGISASISKVASLLPSLDGITVLSSVPGTEDLMTEEDEIVANTANVSSKKSGKKSSKKGTKEDTEDEVVAEEEEEIQQESAVVVERVEDEEVPLAVDDTKQKSLIWLWIILAVVIAACGVGTSVAIYKKKNK